jgi:type I restriction enzyme S subunit
MTEAFLESAPKTWDVIRSRFVFREINERSESGEETLLGVSEYTGVTPRAELVEEGDFESRADDLGGYKKCKKGDLVINIMLAWKRGLGVTRYDGIVSPAYCVFRPDAKILPEFAHYLLRSDPYVAEFRKNSSGIIPSRWRMYPEDFWRIPVLLPPIEEQRSIAAYLDKATARIDGLIAKKQRLQELLEEKRRSIIFWTVFWKASWPKRKLKFLCRMKAGDAIGSELIKEAGTYPAYGGGGQRGFTEQFNREGDSVLIGRQGALCGNITLATGKFWASEHAIVAKPAEGVNSRWLGRLLEAMNLNQYSISAAQPGIAVETIGAIQCPLPSADEQQRVATGIDDRLVKIQVVTKRLQVIVERLKEYRASIISGAVTGQLKTLEAA